MEISQLENKTRNELIELARELGIVNHTALKKQDINDLSAEPHENLTFKLSAD